MQAVDFYPHDTALGSCFVSGRYKLAEGERVLDTGVDIDALPIVGRLCLSERAVLDMVETLGWKIVTPEWTAAHEAAVDGLAEALTELDELTHAMSGIVNIAQVQRAMEVIERRALASDKATVEAWAESLQ